MKNIDKNDILTGLFILLILAMSTMGLLRRCNTPQPSRLTERYHHPGGDTLAVAIEMSPLTYNFAHGDSAAGFDYEIISDFAADRGIPVTFRPVTRLDHAFQGLYDGEYDIVVAAMPATGALKKVFPLTDAVYLDKQVLVQRRDSDGTHTHISSQEQLRGDTVWVAEGSPAMTRLRNISFELGDSIHVRGGGDRSAEHLGIMVALGEIRHAVVGEAVARRLADDYPNLDVETPISFNQFQTWAVALSDSTLLRSINEWLDAFKKTERYRRLCDEYLD